MKRLLLTIPLFFLAACELAVEIDVPDNGNQLALAGLVASDSAWHVDLTKVKNILDFPGQFDSVTNATVTITDATDWTSFVLERQIYGRYRDSRKPVAGHQYNIEVEAPGFPTLTATTLAPDAVEILKYEWDETHVVLYEDPRNHNTVSAYGLTITFRDPPGVKNTYEVHAFNYDSAQRVDGEDTITYISKSELSIFINDPAIVDKTDITAPDYYTFRFGDESFDGQEKTITLLMPTWMFFSPFKGALRLYNQGYEFAKFVDDRNLQLSMELDPFAQPVPVYSNVTNRNGIFAIKTATTIEWDIHVHYP